MYSIVFIFMFVFIFILMLSHLGASWGVDFFSQINVSNQEWKGNKLLQQFCFFNWPFSYMFILFCHLWFCAITLLFYYKITYILFFFDNPGCPGQLTRTTTNPSAYWTSCKPSRQVRHCRDDRLVLLMIEPRTFAKTSLAVDQWARPSSVDHIHSWFYTSLITFYKGSHISYYLR